MDNTNKKIVDYKLITESGTDNLNNKINAALDQGWHLYGSPQINQVYFPDKLRLNTVVAQAVVFYE